MENVLLIIIHSRAFDVDGRKTFAKNYKKILKNQFDVIIIDGHGILHPRKYGWFPMWELRLTNQQ